MDIVISEECIKKANGLRHLVNERMRYCPIAQYFWLNMDPVYVKVGFGFITVILQDKSRLNFTTTDAAKKFINDYDKKKGVVPQTLKLIEHEFRSK